MNIDYLPDPNAGAMPGVDRQDEHYFRPRRTFKGRPLHAYSMAMRVCWLQLLNAQSDSGAYRYALLVMVMANYEAIYAPAFERLQNEEAANLFAATEYLRQYEDRDAARGQCLVWMQSFSEEDLHAVMTLAAEVIEEERKSRLPAEEEKSGGATVGK